MPRLVRPLEGKHVLVVGGTSGVGRAVVVAAAEAGAAVTFAGRDEARAADVERGVADAGGLARFVPCEVTDEDQVRALVAAAVERGGGRLDAAVNSAGAAEPGAFKRTAEFTEADFDAAVGVNLKGLWFCLKHELLAMERAEGLGRSIVNVTSINGLGGAQHAALYAATKAGVVSLSKSAAQEYGPAGVRVNALVMGPIATPMLDAIYHRASGGDARARSELEATYAGLVALGRVGAPREAAAAAVWLCSDAASYVTGHSMIVDGGLSSSMR